jgi:nitrogenase-stabilizing/protective protein
MTLILDQLRALSAAEDFFAVLDVPYEPAVLSVSRLHILRRMEPHLRTGGFDGSDEAHARHAARAALAQAYGDFLASSPIAERVFKVHQDAVKPQRPAARPFVALEALTGAA